MIVWRDGKFVDAAGAIAADDRGWLIGDAVFETILIDRGVPAFLQRHLIRLARGCATLGIEREVDEDDVRNAIARVAELNSLTGRAACRVTMSRTGGPRGLAPRPAAHAQLVVSASKAAPPPALLTLMLSHRRRWSSASTNSFKCAGAYAENMLARLDAASCGADEAIMLNEFGRVACAASANIFVVSENLALTPPLQEGAMPGVVRGVVLEEARRLGVEAVEAPLEPSDLHRGTLLLTNSIAGPVRSALDELTGVQGAATAALLIAAYQRRLDEEFGGEPGGGA